MDELAAIERRLARLESRNLSGMGHEAAIQHHNRVGDLRIDMARAAIGEIMESAGADTWMDAPNKAFGGRTPTEAARIDVNLVRQVIDMLASGEPG